MRNLTINKKIYIFIFVLLAALLFVFIVLLVYFKNQSRSGVLGDNPETGEKIIKKERPQTVLEQVSKIVELPEGEIPTITTVTDVNKLSSQPFFKNAKNGDRVLVFTKSGKAIIYRPEANKIIEYSDIDLSKR